MSNCFPCFIVRWILNIFDQPTQENHENWYPTNKSDFTVLDNVNMLSGFRGEDFKKSANQKQELSVVAMFVNGSG
jgi:hypothetical protein